MTTADESALAAADHLDVAAIRADFPILTTLSRGKPLIYLDSAATSQKPRQVIEAITRFYETTNANVHRSPHWLGEQATHLFESARARVADAVNAPAPECVVWVRGTTEAINLVAHAWGEPNLRQGDTVLLTEMEHHSNLVPWHLLAKRKGLRLRFVGVTDEGTLDMEALAQRLDEEPKLFAFVAKSNVLGTENPVSRICAMARERGIKTLVDGAQALPHGHVDFADMGCDFLAFSAHKALGPMGVGCLVSRPEMYDSMVPWQGGGEMIRRVRLEESTYADPPLLYEAGTPSVADAVAFRTALDYLADKGPELIHEHETRLTRLALDLLEDIGVRTFGPGLAALRAGVVSFDVPGAHPHDVATLLDTRGIAIRAGHHCAQPLMRRFGVMATARASFYLYNTEDEVRAFADGVRAVKELFR